MCVNESHKKQASAHKDATSVDSNMYVESATTRSHLDIFQNVRSASLEALTDSCDDVSACEDRKRETVDDRNGVTLS